MSFLISMSESESLRPKTISGVLWSAVERFSLQGVQFVVNIVMARLLLPIDYGMIGMLTVFLQISQTFIDGGFTNALIQRKSKTEIDFSTVFYFNIIIAFIFYALIFFLAPLIADFYNMPGLVSVARVVALSLVVSSFSAIHKIKLTINIDFKTQSKISLIAAFISGIVGIWMAYENLGVWALVTQILISSILQTLLYYFILHWLPMKIFSVKSFKILFSFGSKLLVSSLIHTVYYNLYSIVIGKKFSATDLGYYTRAEQFAILPSSNVNSIISRVTFPILSSIQDDDERLSYAYRKYIRLVSFIIFPLMIGLVVLAKPLIILLLTEKWLGIVVLLQILCLDWMLDHLSIINLNLLYVKGRSDWALRLEIIKKIVATAILFSSISFGVVGMCWGRVLYALIATYLNTRYTKSLIGLSLATQIKDFLPSLITAILMGGIIYSSTIFFSNPIFQLFVGFIVGLVCYITISLVFKINSLHELFLLLKNR